MDVNRRAVDAVTKLNQSSEPIGGKLGLPIDGTRQVNVPNRPGFVYVRLRDDLSETVQAFNETVSPVYDLPVQVEFRNNRYVVIGRDVDRYNSWGSNSPYLPSHGSQHSLLANQFGGGDPVWVDGRQMMPGAVYPSGTSGGPNVLVSEFLFRNKLGNWLYVGNTGTVDLNSLRPNGSNARMVLVCLDYTSGGFVLLTGTTFSASLTGTNQIWPYVPSSNLDQVPLAAVRIVSGTTSIGWDNIYDARQWIDSGFPTGTSGGAGTVESVTGDGVDNTDPNNPVLSFPTPSDIGAVEGAGIVLGNEIVRFNGTTGEQIQGSGVIIDDAGNIVHPVDAADVFDLATDLVNPAATQKSFGVLSDGQFYRRNNDGTYDKFLMDYDLGMTPGGRLTLATGTPTPTSNVTGSNIYYVPYIHNCIDLWDGLRWMTTRFSNPTLAVGALVTGTGYDVFGYLNAGAVELEKLAWTNGIVRVTDLVAMDGRLCKSGDKTRRYLGSFYPTSTSQTEDSAAKRFLWNMYHRVHKPLTVTNLTTHNYNVNILRPFNNSQANSDFEWFVGLVEDAIYANVNGQLVRAATDGAPQITWGLNSTTTPAGSISGIAVSALTGRLRGGAGYSIFPALGYNFACILEASTAGTAPGVSFEAAELSTVWKC
jgi:hypothetical protein